jgi:uncharacterized membrane protein
MADPARPPLPPAVSDNIEKLADFYAEHELRKPRAAAAIERFSHIVGSPGYVAGSLLLSVVWIAYNAFAPRMHWPLLDEPPFFWLQGWTSLNAFLISTTVLIRQHYAAKLAEHHAHLDLQVNLLTEKKTSKIIDLLETLRRDLPGVRHQDDAEATELSHPADARAVLSAIQEERPG